MWIGEPRGRLGIDGAKMALSILSGHRLRRPSGIRGRIELGSSDAMAEGAAGQGLMSTGTLHYGSNIEGGMGRPTGVRQAAVALTGQDFGASALVFCGSPVRLSSLWLDAADLHVC